MRLRDYIPGFCIVDPVILIRMYTQIYEEGPQARYGAALVLSSCLQLPFPGRIPNNTTGVRAIRMLARHVGLSVQNERMIPFNN